MLTSAPASKAARMAVRHSARLGTSTARHRAACSGCAAPQSIGLGQGCCTGLGCVLEVQNEAPLLVREALSPVQNPLLQPWCCCNARGQQQQSTSVQCGGGIEVKGSRRCGHRTAHRLARRRWRLHRRDIHLATSTHSHCVWQCSYLQRAATRSTAVCGE